MWHTTCSYKSMTLLKDVFSVLYRTYAIVTHDSCIFVHPWLTPCYIAAISPWNTKYGYSSLALLWDIFSMFYPSYTAVTHKMWLYIHGSLFWKIFSPRYILVIQPWQTRCGYTSMARSYEIYSLHVTSWLYSRDTRDVVIHPWLAILKDILSTLYPSYRAVTNEMWLYIHGSLLWKIFSPRYILVIQPWHTRCGYKSMIRSSGRYLLHVIS
jgi:hypothetical protein